ncbi:MAG: cytochrome c oxidase subunit II [Candidatus Krumholzibacteria bacterium]|nr:cytochrome c oxidase subunit II [Candidatus Krumholzibacteria bacterium]
MNGASSYSGLVDNAFIFILGTSVLLLIGVTLAMIIMVVKYRRSKNPNPAQIEGSVTLETLWTVLPTILVLVMFYYGWAGFKVMRDIPDDAMPVTVTGQMWSWVFEYENGKQSTELIVPTGRNVKLNLESVDVIHSFFVPAFRLKEDCVPGRHNKAWFQSTRDGEFNIFCAEYCGERHSAMLSLVKSIPPREFDEWLGVDPGPPEGAQLLAIKGCTACHSLDGSKLIGPSFKGAYGRTETVLTDGVAREIVVDDDYIRKSMLEPDADLVEGYPKGLMPPQGTLLKDADIDAIIEVLKELK